MLAIAAVGGCGGERGPGVNGGGRGGAGDSGGASAGAGAGQPDAAAGSGGSPGAPPDAGTSGIADTAAMDDAPPKPISGADATDAGSSATGDVQQPPSPPTLPWPQANAIVAAVTPPTFPDRQCPIDMYGGKGDGTSDNTAAIAAAVSACSNAGGGHVVVPAGNFLTGAIALLDNVDLHLSAGARLAFSGDESQYPLVLTRYQGIELMNRSPMIYAYQRQNIAVTGAGTLDASATVSWNRTDAAAWDMLVAWGEAGTAVKDRVLPAGMHLRASVVMPYASKSVLLDGFTTAGSPFWQIHPTLSSSVRIRGVATSSSGPETVGLVIESSDDVVVENGAFVAGSDCIALKSGRDADGRRVNKPTRNVVIVRARCQGVGGFLAVGSESTGGVQNVFAYDLATTGTAVDSLLFIKSTPTRGGTTGDVFLDSVMAAKLRGAFFSVNLVFAGVTTGNFPPTVGAMTFSHVSVDGATRVFSVQGLPPPASPVGPISVSDATFTGITDAQGTLTNAQAVTYTRVTVNGASVN